MVSIVPTKWTVLQKSQISWERSWHVPQLKAEAFRFGFFRVSSACPSEVLAKNVYLAVQHPVRTTWWQLQTQPTKLHVSGSTHHICQHQVFNFPSQVTAGKQRKVPLGSQWVGKIEWQPIQNHSPERAILADPQLPTSNSTRLSFMLVISTSFNPGDVKRFVRFHRTSSYRFQRFEYAKRVNS